MALAFLPNGHSYGYVEASHGAAIHCGDVVDRSIHHHYHYRASDGRLIESEPTSLNGLLPSEISDYDAAATLRNLLERHLPGTCGWLQDKPLFQDWKSGEGLPFLYISGSVGSGKTILAASTIRQLYLSDLGEGRTTIHFFVGEAMGSGSELARLLRALTRQLWQFMIEHSIDVGPNLIATMRTQFYRRKAALPISELGDVLMQLIDKCSLVTIIIDAIDRFTEEDVTKFIGLSGTLSTRCGRRLRMLCFCRDVLGRGIRPVSELPLSRHITIELSDVRSDISCFVDHEVEQLQIARPITQNLQLIEEAKSVLKDNSNKMLVSKALAESSLTHFRFLWIYFQLRNIWSPDFTTCDGDIRRQLQDLPDGLEQIYIRCLERIEQNCKGRSQDIAMKAFKWVSCVKLPIRSRQLREAISIEPQNLPLRADRVINLAVTDFCANLLVIHPATDVVSFAHHSVQTFLQGKEKLPESLRKYHLDAKADDMWCGEICMAYCEHLLSMRSLVPRNTSRTSISMKELLTTEFSASGVGKLLDKSAQLFGLKNHHDVVLPIPTLPARGSAIYQNLEFHHYLRIGWLVHSCNISRNPALFVRFKELCLSADPIVHPWLKRNSSASEHLQRLLEHAAAHDHIPLFLTLTENFERKKTKASLKELLCEVSPDTKQTLIHLAAIRGSLNVIRELLKHVDVNERDQDGMNVVARAMQAHQNDVAAYLLEHGADAVVAHLFQMQEPSSDGRVNNWSNSLIAVCASAGNLEGIKLVQRLQPWPRNTSLALLGTWQEALFAACWYGHQDVAEYIMRAGGTDPRFMPCIPSATRIAADYYTLPFAVEMGYYSLATTIVKLLRIQDRDTMLFSVLELSASHLYRLLDVLQQNDLDLFSDDDGTRIYLYLSQITGTLSPLRASEGNVPNSRKNQIFGNPTLMLLISKLSCEQLPAFEIGLAMLWTQQALELWLRYASDEILLYMLEHPRLHEPLVKKLYLELQYPEYVGAKSAEIHVKALASRKGLRVLSAIINSQAFQDNFLNLAPMLTGECDGSVTRSHWRDSSLGKGLRLLLEALLVFENRPNDRADLYFNVRAKRCALTADAVARANVVVYVIQQMRQRPKDVPLRSWLKRALLLNPAEVPKFNDYSLNFPFGYEELADGVWCVRGHIKVSVYLWSWRLNRKRGKAFSTADRELLRLLFDHHLKSVRSKSDAKPPRMEID